MSQSLALKAEPAGATAGPGPSPNAALHSGGPARRDGARRFKICLAAGGGGHIRQALDLRPVWEPYDHFFVSDDTGLSRSVAEDHRSYFLPAVAVGQAKLGKPFKMIAGAVRSCLGAAKIMARERPDVLISTGGGAAFFPLLWAKIFGARVVLIESFARFDSLSIFARASAPLADHKIVQSARLKRFWPDAPVFDPLKVLGEAKRPPKKALAFATVGTMLPFDRLVDMVAGLKEAGVLSEELIVQVGVGGHRPAGLNVFETLPFSEVTAILADADLVVCHGGTGSLITALRQGCRVVAVPRKFEFGEHYDDHQEEVTRAFEARGLISVANSTGELSDAIARARARDPVLATSDPSELIGHLSELVGDWKCTADRVSGRPASVAGELPK